jgi:PKD repeat protein
MLVLLSCKSQRKDNTIQPNPPALLQIMLAMPPDGMVGAYYSHTLRASGGTLPYARSITDGSLPGGLGLDSATGVISGTPDAAGAFSFTVMVTDSSLPDTQTDTALFSITIELQGGTLRITNSSPLPQGTETSSYSTTLIATGGVTPYSWSVVSGLLPDGLNLNASTGQILGTPSQDSTFAFNIEVTDSGSPSQTVSKNFSITVDPILPLQITSSTLPNGIEDVAYTFTVEATGDITPYTWSIAGLASGLSIDSSTGEITGTPDTGTSNSSPYTVTITVTDSSSPPRNDSKEFPLVITPLGTPVAGFTVEPMSGEAPLTVQFTDTSTGSITLWEWDFDNDGTVDSTEQNPSHIYNNLGTYSVCLAVTYPGGSDTETKIDHVTVLVTGQIIYVDGANGDDENNGTSWGDAVKTIQKGIDLASDYFTVLVADGTYKGAGNKNLDFAGKKVHLKSQNGAESCIVDCEDSGRGFYFHSGETSETIVEGFTIRKGNADNPGGGGGISCENSSPTITNCTITNNSGGYGYGGGIRCNLSSLTITNCTITGNLANYGGGIYCRQCSPTITNCLVTNNSAEYGGGIYFNKSNAPTTNCTIADNSATKYGGGFYCC